MKIITLDLGGTFIKAALMNENSEILEQWKVPSPTSSLEELLEALDNCVKPHLEGADGIAMSMPGRIDIEKGIAHTGGAFNFIKDLEIKKIMEERYNVPVWADNDGKCAANAENWVGALKDVSSGLVYVIGTGIGGGIIINNQVHRGFNFAAGELSCCLINVKDEVSFRNWTAMQMATPALLQQYAAAAQLEEKVDGIEFFKRVNEKDPIARDTLRYFAQMTAAYFYNLQTVLDIEKIAIGGGISAQPVLLEFIKEEVDKIWLGKYGMMFPSKKPEIVLCQYGNDANLIGALKNWLDHQN